MKLLLNVETINTGPLAWIQFGECKGPPMNRFTLSQTELAILLYYLAGDGALLSQARAGLGLAQTQISEVEANLFKRGLLTRMAGELTVSNETATLLAATLYPATLAILNLTQRYGATLPFYFSFTPATIVMNHVDHRGLHTFIQLNGFDAVVSALLDFSYVPEEAYAPNLAPQTFDDLSTEAQVTALLMVIKNPADVASVPTNIGWLLNQEILWLTDSSSAMNSFIARPITPPQLRDTLHTIIATHASHTEVPYHNY